jgi:tetratricopeptide (TPR) repeat protein
MEKIKQHGWHLTFSRGLGRKALVWIFASACLMGILALAHGRIGFFVWNQFHTPGLAILLNPDAKFAVSIGNYYFNVEGNGRYDLNRASVYFKKALGLDPRVPGAWHQLARIDFLRGAFVPALEKINKHITIQGDSFMASYYIRGLIEGYKGDLDAAEKDFQKFKEWDPHNWAIHNDLAWIYFQKGDFDATEREARAGLASNRDNAWLLTAQGVALLNLWRVEDATARSGGADDRREDATARSGGADDRREDAKAALTRAERIIAGLTENDWHTAYPGNDPRAASRGLADMKKIISQNMLLLEN